MGQQRPEGFDTLPWIHVWHIIAQGEHECHASRQKEGRQFGRSMGLCWSGKVECCSQAQVLGHWPPDGGAVREGCVESLGQGALLEEMSHQRLALSPYNLDRVLLHSLLPRYNVANQLPSLPDRLPLPAAMLTLS